MSFGKLRAGAACAFVAMAACSEPPPPARTAEASTLASDTVAPAAAEAFAHLPVFGFGREATPEEIAAWDIDVMPDGEGLPPGEGSVARGAVIYKAQCVSCHGARGEGGQYEALVGREPRRGFPFGRDPRIALKRTIGNYWPYATTLYDYIYRSMPQAVPGSLRPDEVYSLVAFLLYLNQIVPEDAVMNAETLPAVVMPARDRFVVDDRKGGSEIR